MSVKTSARVWEHSSQSGSDMLVLLALADHSDDDGVCWPGLERVSFKARILIRQTKRVIKKLVEAGELFIEYQQGQSGGRGYTNNYFVTTGLSIYEIKDILERRFEIDPAEAEEIASNLVELQHAQMLEQERMSSRVKKGVTKDTQKRVSSRTKRVSSRTKRVSSEAQKGVIAMTPEPSVEPSFKPSVEPSAAAATPAANQPISEKEVISPDPIQEPITPPGPPPLNGHHKDPPPIPYPPAADPPPDDDPAFTQVCRLYQAEIGKMSPLIAQEIRDRLKRCPVGWFEKAISKAAAAEARRWNYIKSILIAWEKCGGPENDRKNGASNGYQQSGTYSSGRTAQTNQESGSGREGPPEADGMSAEWRAKLERLTFTFDPNTPNSG